MRTAVTNHNTGNTKMEEIVKMLRGRARLNVAEHGTYFSLKIETCLDYECLVYSTHLNGYDYAELGEDEMLDEENMNHLAGLLKRSTKWTFADERKSLA
jgi:hypothetical protein